MRTLAIFKVYYLALIRHVVNLAVSLRNLIYINKVVFILLNLVVCEIFNFNINVILFAII